MYLFIYSCPSIPSTLNFGTQSNASSRIVLGCASQVVVHDPDKSLKQIVYTRT